jgi:hypothetical protein
LAKNLRLMVFLDAETLPCMPAEPPFECVQEIVVAHRMMGA